MRMANRFPLVLDTTDNNKIKEIQTGDNLNLADNSIVGVQNITALGTIDAADIKVNGNKLVAQAFNDLTDTPSTFVGSPNYFVKVKSDGTGLEYRPLADLGNIEIDTITVDTSIVPSVNNVGNVGTEAKKFNEIVGTSIKGNLVSYNEEIVFDATTGKVSYAALQGAPTFLSEFTDDVGYLQTTDLDTTLAGLFDDGVPFTTDIVGSVFGDDSTLLVDGVNGKIIGDVLNTEVTTTGLVATNATITTTTATTINGPSTGNLAIDAGTSGIINIGAGASTTAVNIENAVIETFAQGTGLGIAEITASTDLQITAGNRVKIDGGVPFRFSSTTTANQLAIAAQEGDVIYNTTTSRLQMYQGGAWKDVNGNVEATAGTSTFNDVTIAGNLIVQGTTTSIETTNTTITDNVIVLNNGEVGAGVTATTSGIEIDRGTSPNRSLVWTENYGGKWIVTDDSTFFADRVEANYLFGSLTIETDNLVMGDGDITATGTLTVGGGELVQIVSVSTDIELLPVGKVKIDGNLEVTGTFDGDVTGSVFGDDSTVLVDGNNNKVVGDIDNAEVLTTTVQGRDSEALNIYRGTTGSVIVGDASSGSMSVSDSGINITATAGVDINGAATGTVNIGTGATTGNVTIGKVGNTTTIDGTFNATLTGNVVGNMSGDVTGNIDNTTLTVGATTATTIGIGNAGSTTTINGIVNFGAALVAANITADDSIIIQTGVGDGNAITVFPKGTNTSINLRADALRLFGTPFTDSLAAQGGIVGDIKGSVVADDSTILVDSVGGKIVGDIESTNIHGQAFKADTIVNNTGDILDITAGTFLNIFGGSDDLGVSNIQMDKNGINHIEIKTEPGNPADPTDYARVAINAGTNEGDVRIGTPTSTRNQVVEIYNATVNGTLVGSVTGSVTGTVTGDVQGSVFADDSSPMVDGTNYAMFSDTMSLTPLNAEPANPISGMIASADGTTWDPGSKSGAVSYPVFYDGVAWNALY